MTSHTLSPTPATAAEAAAAVTDRGSADAAALVWDLTVHRLHQAFAQCLEVLPEATHEGQRPAAATSQTGPRRQPTAVAVDLGGGRDRAQPAQQPPVPARAPRRVHHRDRPEDPAPTALTFHPR